jgi:hypothetical protein
MPAQPGLAARAYQVLAVAGDPHLFPRGGRRTEHEQVARQPRVGTGAVLDGAFDARPPRCRHHRRQREDEQQHQHRVDAGGEQGDDDAEAEHPAERGEQRHEQVIEPEGVPAQHLEPVEMLASFLVGNGCDARVQPGDVRFHRDAHAVAEPPLHAIEDDLQIPEQRGRHREPQRGKKHLLAVVVADPVDEDGQPQADQRLRQRGEQGHRERHGEQPRLDAVGELHHPPE